MKPKRLGKKNGKICNIGCPIMQMSKSKFMKYGLIKTQVRNCFKMRIHTGDISFEMGIF